MFLLKVENLDVYKWNLARPDYILILIKNLSILLLRNLIDIWKEINQLTLLTFGRKIVSVIVDHK